MGGGGGGKVLRKQRNVENDNKSSGSLESFFTSTLRGHSDSATIMSAVELTVYSPIPGILNPFFRAHISKSFCPGLTVCIAKQSSITGHYLPSFIILKIHAYHMPSYAIFSTEISFIMRGWKRTNTIIIEKHIFFNLTAEKQPGNQSNLAC